ncbi:hypothetical protein [Kitasatospora sp. NBC_01266]|uniref:hypothetical protein n=1 Tax=Kitasatospora sp. NBC_01266 TaxID=2903572 RepID=UPI002E33B9EA|nr:hypothetical protein [Kitasatospora sp. NBC_01266]
MTELSWRPATKADRALLQGFTCTESAPRPPGSRRPLPHPRPWEVDVQTWFRGGDALADAYDDAARGGRLLLGFAGGDLAVCASHARLNHPGVETPLRRMLEWDGPIRDLKALAVACSHRRCGGLVADEAMEHTLGGMLTDESDLPTLVISRIDPRNRASEKFASRHGFELIDDLPRPDQHRNWFTVIEVD